MLQRRKPGQNFNLWSVEPPGELPIGYLVTDRERSPNPIAFVPTSLMGRSRERGYALACAIRDGRKRPGTFRTIDLRHGEWWKRCPQIMNVKLLPIDAAGHYVGNRTLFVCGHYFMGNQVFKGVGFMMTVRQSFRLSPQAGQQEGGKPETPTLPVTGIARETKALHPTAA